MRVSEAKDFLVQQTAEQAQREGVPLSSLEKRMMHFTEGADASEDPVKLNDEFEAEYDTTAYESKISGLLNRAYARIRKEDADSVRMWNDSVRLLQKGDHYILVLLGPEASSRLLPGNLLKPRRAGILAKVMILAAFAFLMLGFPLLSAHYGVLPRGWHSGPRTTYASTPLWAQWLIVVLLVGGYFCCIVLPWILKKLRG